MTHTLESLKKILDEGGTIIQGSFKFCKKEGQYHFDSGLGNSGPCSTLFLEYVLSMGEWSEVISEPTTITVPIDQWNALNKELGELKAKSHKSFIDEALDAIKAKMDDIYKEHGIVPLMSQSQTLDPAAEYGASFDEPLPAPVRNTEEIKKGWDEFSIAMYRKAVEDIGWKFTSNEASARDQLSKEPFTSLAKYYKDTHPPIGLGNGLIEDLTSRKPYTFLIPIPAEIMVGIKAGQTWSNGYYTSSGCNEIGIYFDHRFGTTSVPWELVAGFIEENKIWEKL